MMVCIYVPNRFVFQSLCYIIYFIRSAVSCDLRFSSILIFLSFYFSSSNFFLIMIRISVQFGLDVCCIWSTQIAQICGPLQLVSELRLSEHLGFVELYSLEIGSVVP